MHEHWIADQMRRIEVSGIRKVFDLAAHLKDPVNLSIGQPHFPVPEPIKAAAKAAIDRTRTATPSRRASPSCGQRFWRDVRKQFPNQADRELFVTSGTSGGLVLALVLRHSIPATRSSSSIPTSSCIRTSSRWPAARR